MTVPSSAPRESPLLEDASRPRPESAPGSLLRSRIVSALGSGLSAWLPFAVVFVIFPTSIVAENVGYWRGDFDILIPAYLWSAAALLGCISFAAAINHWGSSQQMLGFPWSGFVIGVYLVVADWVAPVRLDRPIGYNGSESMLFPSVGELSLEIALALTCAALIARIRFAAITQVAPVVVIVFLALSMQQLDRKASHEVVSDARMLTGDSGKWISHATPPEHEGNHPNVYVILLDGFQGSTLPAVLREAGMDKEDWDGFIYFKNNRSNYPVTNMSLPSIMSGTVFERGLVEDWVQSSLKSGLWGDLTRVKGTQIWLYHADPNRYMLAPFHYLRRLDLDHSRRSLHALLEDLTLARVVPSFLHSEVYSHGEGFFTNEALFQENVHWVNVELFDLMMQDEYDRKEKGQLINIHVISPHAPYVFTRNCEVQPWKSGYIAQAACGLTKVQEFLNVLRQEGRYRDSLIIVHSDHGSGQVEFPLSPPVSRAVTEHISSIEGPALDLMDVQMSASDVLDAQLSALLLVKPPGQAGVPLVVSNQVTQATDIVNTVRAALGVEQKGDGWNLLDERLPEDRDISLFAGIGHVDTKTGRLVWLWDAGSRAEHSHYMWNLEKGWRVMPNRNAPWK